ncbi:MAG: hypothetical protein KAY24_05270 [Candidatus Eisenbacteria sp.]|nr:hypothetical protein [Candidatus Eisenbacteria bacterium]
MTRSLSPCAVVVGIFLGVLTALAAMPNPAAAQWHHNSDIKEEGFPTKAVIVGGLVIATVVTIALIKKSSSSHDDEASPADTTNESLSSLPQSIPVAWAMSDPGSRLTSNTAQGRRSSKTPSGWRLMPLCALHKDGFALGVTARL